MAGALSLAIACNSGGTPSGTSPGTSPDRPVRVRSCSGPATSLPDSVAAALPARTGQMTPDDQWADLATRVPGGFAGVLYEGGQPVIMFTHPESADVAKPEIAQKIPEFPVLNATVRRVRWDFAQLVNWYNYLNPRVFGPSEMVSSDKDEGLNRISFGVTNEGARAVLVKSLLALNVPCDLVVVEITSPINIDKGSL